MGSWSRDPGSWLLHRAAFPSMHQALHMCFLLFFRPAALGRPTVPERGPFPEALFGLASGNGLNLVVCDRIPPPPFCPSRPPRPRRSPCVLQSIQSSLVEIPPLAVQMYNLRAGEQVSPTVKKTGRVGLISLIFKSFIKSFIINLIYSWENVS